MKMETILNSTKTIFYISIIVILGALVWKAFAYFDNKINVDNLIAENQKTLVDIARGIQAKEVMVSTELLNMRMKELDAKILEYTKQNNLQINSIGKMVASLEGSVSELKGEKYTDPDDPDKDFDEVLVEREEVAREDDKKKLPVATMYYSPGDHEKPWTANAHPLEFTFEVALAESTSWKDQKEHSIMSAYVANPMMDGKNKDGSYKYTYPLNIKHTEWVKREREKSFIWNPRLSLGGSIGDDIYPTLGVSLFSYGESKHNMDWRFIDVGFGGTGSDMYAVQLIPVEYNIGKPLPLLENLFLGPYINYDQDGEVGWGGNFNIPF